MTRPFWAKASALACAKGDDALRESLNAGIAAILADGTHAEITSRYFTTSIYSE